MRIHNIEQRTPEWHQLRIGKVTGSVFKKVTKAQWKNFTDIIAIEQLTGESEEDEDGYVSFDMQVGIDREPIAFEYASEFNKIEFTKPGFIQSSEFPNFGVSPDGLSKCETIILEIKCEKRAKHLRNIRMKKIPADHMDQVLAAFCVSDQIEKVIFASYNSDIIVDGKELMPYWQIIITREMLKSKIYEAKKSLTKFFNQVETTKQLLNR